MFNLLKSDLYRLVHGKMLWVALVVMLVASAVGTGILAFAASPEFAQMVNAAAELNMVEQDAAGSSADTSSSNPSVELSIDNSADLNEEEVAMLNDKTFDSLSYSIAQMLFSGGFVGMLSGLVTGLFLISDFSTGFAKTLLSSCRGRSVYYAEKLVLAAVIAAAYVGASAIITAVMDAVAGFAYSPGESAGELALWLFLTWLITTAYNFIVAVVAWLSRSKVAAVLAAVLISTTIGESLILTVIDFASIALPVLAKISWLLPASSFNLLRDGSAGLLSPQPGLLFPILTPAAQITLVCVVYIIVFAAMAMTLCKRKDIYYR